MTEREAAVVEAARAWRAAFLALPAEVNDPRNLDLETRKALQARVHEACKALARAVDELERCRK